MNKATNQVTIEQFRRSIRLRWGFQKERYSLTVGPLCKENAAKAVKLKRVIETDLQHHRFDFTLYRYHTYFTPRVTTTKPVKERARKVSKVAAAFIEWTNKSGMSPIPSNIVTVKYMLLRWNLDSFDQVPAMLVKQTYAAVTYNVRLNVLRRFYKWLKKVGYIENNPVEDLENRRDSVSFRKDLRKPLEDHEIKLILEALRTDQFTEAKGYPHSTYYPFIRFLFSTGVRNGEAIGLQVKKINFYRKYITIDASLSRSRKGTNPKARILKGTKTNNTRNLPLTEELEALLKPLCEGKRPDDFVFTSVHGNPIDDHMFQKRVFKPVLKKLGIEERDLYAIRHTFGTIAIEQGLNVMDAAYLMGHSRPTTILLRYTHLRKVPERLPKIG